METIIKCPDCGKTFKITITEENTQSVTLTTPKSSNLSWQEIEALVQAGSIKVGDEVGCTLKNGKEVVFVAAAVNPYGDGQVAFVIKDCLSDTHYMNKECTNDGGWYSSDMREWLNKDIWELLPDDLKAVIKTRKILQKIDGDVTESEDKLWLLSCKEVTGEDYNDDPTDFDDVHFPLFSDERSRVKQIDGETCWYWLRSPNASYSTNFCNVSSSGSASNYSATNSRGVAFSFII